MTALEKCAQTVMQPGFDSAILDDATLSELVSGLAHHPLLSNYLAATEELKRRREKVARSARAKYAAELGKAKKAAENG